MLDDKEKVISTLRACLMSTQGGVPVSHLQRDYKSLVGQPIPFQKCGFSTLEMFLKSEPGIKIYQDRSGNVLVEAVVTESSAHISSLINRQKKSGSKRRPPRPYAPSRKPLITQSWKPPPSSYRPPNKVPLSITLDNRNYYPSHIEKQLRTVTVGNTSAVQHQYSPPISPNQNSPNPPSPVSKDYSHKPKYQKPPRLQKASAKNYPESTVNTPAVDEVSNFQTNAASVETIRKGFRSKLSINKELGEKKLEEFGCQMELNSPPIKTITSPFAPSLAVAAGRAKTDADAVLDLKKNHASYMQPLDEVEAVMELKKNFSSYMLPFDEINVQAEAVWDSQKNYPSYMQPLDVNLQQDYHTLQPRQDYRPSHAREQWSRGYEPRLSPPYKSRETFAYCAKLKSYSQDKGWPEPVYKILPRYPKGSRPLYGCLVKIGNGSQVASYPEESVIPEEAREFAAKKAYTKLEQIDKEASMDSDRVTEDKALMCERVSKLVSLHTNGLWSYMVLNLYKKTYHENVPDDWLTILTSCPNVSMTRVSENKVIITPNQPSLDNLTQYSAMSAYAEPKAQEEVLYVPELTLPEENHWSVYITCLNSTTEVWARLIGDDYSTEYENMTTDMEVHYFNVKESVECPEVGYYYAAPFEDSWFRVCVQEIVDDKAVCWLIDHGDIDDFPFNKLFKLDKKFFPLPRQVVQCQLAGLEDYGDEKIAHNLMIEMLLGKTFVAEVQARDLNTGIASLVLYDTSTEEDINVNETLINRICIEGAKPQLPSEGSIKEAFISTVTDKGEVYIQIRQESFSHLQRLIEGLDPAIIDENKVNSFKDIVMNKMYLARFSVDSKWYRALVIEPPSQQHNKIEVRFIDFGNTDTVTISDISEVETISSVLANLPYQAIKVQLHNVPLSSMTLAKAIRIQELLQDVIALVKVITAGEVPTVEIFKRVMPDNALVSINSTIALDPDLNQQQQEPRKRSTPSVGIGMKYLTETGQGDGLPPRGLQSPHIPSSSKEYFDIYVPMVASPSNFTVQPLMYMDGFHDLMTKMQDHYMEDSSELEAGEVFEGGVYAVLNSDRSWYRATVISIRATNVVVHFCDFGDVTVIPLSDMKPLHQQFKELPYLAIKAKLSGIAPSHSDWSVEDCLRFQKLICEKHLVSIVMETGPDILNHTETVLGLRIIDTNTDEDIDIAALLISEGRAIQLPNPPISSTI